MPIARGALFLFLCSVMFGANALAQPSVSVSGQVLDPTGAAVVGAGVHVQLPGGRVVRTTADSSGRFRLEGLPRGDIAVVVEHPGFARAERHVSIEPEMAALIFRLIPEGIRETVEVRGRAGYSGGDAAVATRVPIPLIDLPQSVQVITPQLLEDQQILRVGEATRNVSGITRAIGYTDAGDRFTIRGFRTDYTLKNGFKNNALLTLTDVANIDRVEVLKGPASILYGRIEPGGVVNVVTKQPPRSAYRSVRFVADQYGSVRPAIDIGGPFNQSGSLRYRLNGSFESARGFRQDVRPRTWFVAPSFQWEPSTRTAFAAEGEYLDLKGQPDAGFPLSPIAFDLPAELNVGAENDSISSRNGRFSYSFTHRFGNKWSLMHAASWLDVQAQRFQVRPSAYEPWSRVIERDANFIEQTSRNVFVRTDLSTQWMLGGMEHKPLFGIEVGREQYGFMNRSGGFSDYDLWYPVRGRLSDPPNSPGMRNERQASMVSAYVQDPIAIGRWRILAGLRFDIGRIRRLDRIGGDEPDPVPPAPPGTPPGVGPAPGPGPGPAPGPGPGTGVGPGPGGSLDPDTKEEKPRSFSPQFGVVFHASTKVSLFASVARSFNPLQTEEIAPYVLNPSRGTQYEAGVRFGQGRRISASVAAFRIAKTGLLTIPGLSDREPDENGNIEVSDDEILGADQSGVHTSNGLEADILLRPWSHLEITTAHAYIHSDRQQIGRLGETDSLNTPRHSGSAWATYTGQTGLFRNLTVGIGGMYSTSRLVRWTSDFRLPAWHRFDAMIGRQLGRARIQLNLANLTSERYYETDSVFGFIWPAQPRHARVSVTYAF